jgi:nicotinic acid mononucleotide adenylyltransferase
MPELRTVFDGAELYMLMGSDVVWTFPDRWADLDDLFAQTSLVIGLRSGDTKRELKKILKSLDVIVHPRYTFVDSPLADASSTRVRRGTVERDVTPEVSSYIKQHQLYKGRG